jgi:hypothetical protein
LGIATVTGTTGVGSECRLEPDGSVPVPAEISQWSDQVVPIPLPTILQSSSEKDVGGISGVALVVIRGGGLEADALAAGHAAFNDGMQNALNELIAKHRPLDPKIEPDETKTLFDAVQRAMSDAIAGAMDWKDKVHGWLEPPAFASTYVYFSQDDLPTDDFDQQDFDPTSDHGPALFPWEWEADPNVSGLVGLNGGVGRSRRATGQGVLRQLAHPVRAVAGFTSADGYQHAVAATDDGALTEMWRLRPGEIGSGLLARFTHQIVGLAGYYADDGYRHVIVATGDGNVTEVYWQASSSPGQDTLLHFDRRILALAGYYSAGDGYQNVIVATDDGNLTQLYWVPGNLGHGTLSHLDSPVVDLAGYEAGGVHHVIAATQDGTITELTWSAAAAVSARTLAQVEAHPWNHVIGVGAYDADPEQHVIVAMSNGTLRDFHAGSADNNQNPPQLLHTDLATMAAVVPIIDAYPAADGYQHAIVATADRGVHELWWSYSGPEVVSTSSTARDIALVRQTPGWGSIPVAFSNGDGTWAITNGPAVPFIGGDEWASGPGVRVVTGDFNGNGRTDIALVRQTPGWGSIPVAFSNGDGTWAITNGPAVPFIGGDEWASGPGVRVVTGDFH